MNDALLRDLVREVREIKVEQAAARAEQNAFRSEYSEGKKASMHNARTNAARVDSMASKVDGIDLRTQKQSQQLEVLDEKADRTNGRVTTLERKDIARDAVADVRRWRFPAFIAVVASVTSSLTVAGVIALLTLR